jgi:osmotically-inducible protein OsmY
MFARTTLAVALAAALSAAALVTLPGCSIMRGQETVGSYVDDATITTQVKARMVDNKDVDAGAIKVETLNGTVLLSGFAKSANEKATAESIARNVNGVKSVKNEILIRP